uniref:Glycoside hydrolase family 29 N-terminal domain-containing protein n=1 Tax=Ignisphaera aggregans TaxID=334771 RepID=A0A7J2U580_9CREN
MCCDVDWSYFRKHYEEFNKSFKPSWFHDVKFGVIIHWGPYSVPGWGFSFYIGLYNLMS